jgi:stage III sporulation protein AB
MRLCGAIFLFAFFSLCGVFAGEKEKKRLRECEAFLEFFGYIKNQVEYFLTPTKAIYRGFSCDVLESCGFLPALRSHENDEVYCDVWSAALASSRKSLHLTEKERLIVLGFGACIGKSQGEIQTASFDRYISEMSAEIAREKAENEKNVKLYRTLGIAAGACAAILAI